MILTSAVFDRQTDGRNCDSTCALSTYAVARKNDKQQLVTCSGVKLEHDVLISDAERDEVTEAGSVVGVVKQYSIVASCRLEHKPYVDRVQRVTNCLVCDERRTTELRQTDLCSCDRQTAQTVCYKQQLRPWFRVK